MNMREKMARAIFEGPPSEWDRMDPIIRAACFRQADAALSAMEEPTEEMVAAGGDELLAEWDDPIGATTAIFRAMLAKAKEG